MLAIQYPGSNSPESVGWEHKLQNEVCKYLEHIWRAAGAPLQVYVALDGVVPYAKIKQQRFRRFKSAAAKCAESEAQWDTNAITPGTAFMASMAKSLKQTALKHGWIISDTDEAGEGEHKVLRWLLATKLREGPIIVYGLDADLILLCLLAGDKLGDSYPLFLLREAQVFGKLVRSSENDNVELGFFKVGVLRESLQKGKWSREQFYDYIFGMSFCGNDFLPTGLSLRIRDEGHSILLSCLDSLWKSNKHLIVFENDVALPDPDGLKAFAKWMLQQEDRLVLTTIRKKMSARLGESEEDNLPIREQAERPLVLVNGDKVVLKSGWQTVYSRLALGDADKEHRKKCAHDFWNGWCWILRYYQGLPIDLEWVYPAGYPPTWRDLLDNFPESLHTSGLQVGEPLKPQEQLTIVLPLSSWSLLLETPYRNLPAKLPQFWPSKFHLETFGKRFGWECEPLIPMLTPGRLRYEFAHTSADKCAHTTPE
jgi:5'-3' exonuclease